MDSILGTCPDTDYSALKIVVQDSGLNFCLKYLHLYSLDKSWSSVYKFWFSYSRYLRLDISWYLSAYFSLIYLFIMYTEIYTLKSRRVNFRSQTDVNQSNVAYCFSHMWEKWYVRSRVSCFFTCEPYGKLKFSFKAGWRGFVHRTSHRFASLKRANSFYSHYSPTIQSESCITETERRWKRIRIEESDSD